MSISTRALSKSNARGLRQRRHDKLGCGEVIADRFVQPCCVHTVHRRYPARMPRGSVSRTQCHSPTVGTGRTGLLAGASREAAAPLARSGGGGRGFGRTGHTPAARIRGRGWDSAGEGGGRRGVPNELTAPPRRVFAGEVDRLRERLAAASAGRAFLLQGGDCAETFAGATADRIRNRVKTVLQ